MNTTTIKSFFRYWPVALLAVTALVGEALCDLYQPTALSYMVDRGVVTHSPDVILYYALRMLGITFLGMLCAATRSILASHVSQRFGRDLRLSLYRQIHRLSLSRVDRFDRASLITRLTNDVTQVQNFFNGMMRFYLRGPILCVGGIVMAARLNPSMAQILFIIVPIALVIIALSMRVGYPFFYKVQITLDRLNENFREYLSGVRVVKAFNRFDYERNRFEAANGDLTDASATAMRVTAFFGPAITLVVNLGIAAVILIAGRNAVESGQVIAFIGYMTQIMFALSMFSMVFTQLVRAIVSGRRIDEVLTARDPAAAAALPATTASGLAFEDVAFRYPEASAPVFEHIRFSLLPGETLGIIGATGSGKSTLIHLIPRFYDVTKGAVRIDGVDTRAMDPHELRARMGIVPQQSVLFTGTIADNLRWGNEDAGEAEIRAALEAAQAADFVDAFPEGLETHLGQGGTNLSGGQKQRLCIARALIRKPELLLLDDCTSAVDVQTEARIRQSLRGFGRDMMCVIVSQRIVSVMNADRILVLDRGGIVGYGPHDDLLDSCEVYRDIYRSQIGEEVEHVG